MTYILLQCILRILDGIFIGDSDVSDACVEQFAGSFFGLFGEVSTSDDFESPMPTSGDVNSDDDTDDTDVLNCSRPHESGNHNNSSKLTSFISFFMIHISIQCIFVR